MIARFAIGLVVAILVQGYSPQPATARKPETLRNEVREIIRPKCGGCHTSTLPTAKLKALAIFDLTRDDWPATISKQQFSAFNRRLADLPDTLKQTIDRFVSDEIAHRRAPGS